MEEDLDRSGAVNDEWTIRVYLPPTGFHAFMSSRTVKTDNLCLATAACSRSPRSTTGSRESRRLTA
jgi:hypothetical protein